MPDAQKETNSTQDTKGKQREEDMNTKSDKEHRNDGKNIVRTKCGRIVKKKKKKKKKQTGSCMNATHRNICMLDTVQKSNALPHFLHKRNTFSFGFFIDWPAAQHASL